MADEDGNLWRTPMTVKGSNFSNITIRHICETFNSSHPEEKLLLFLKSGKHNGAF